MSTKYEKKNVEEYLRETDYEFKGYMPKAEALLFVNFIKEVNNGAEENETPIVHLKMMDKVFNKDKRCAIMCHRGIGKALSLNSTLYTDQGETTMASVKVGDKVIGEDGQLTTVTTKSKVFHKKMYRISLADGRKIDVCEDHINTIIHRRQKRIKGKRVNYLDRRNLTTTELLSTKLYSTRSKTKKNPKGIEARVWIPTAKAANYSEKIFKFDPYTLGLFLGDGSSNTKDGYLRITSDTKDVPEYLDKIPYLIGSSRLDPRSENTVTFGVRKVGKILKGMGLNVSSKAKFIPEEYFTGSIEQRLELLKGLMDSDGTVTASGNMSFSNNSLLLAEGVKRLVQSLGGVSTVYTKKDSYNVSVRLSINPFYLHRKRVRYRPNAPKKVAITSIEPIPSVASQCISVDNTSHTFLTDGYTVTHNTTVFAEYLILFVAAFGVFLGFGKVNLMLYVTDSIENGVKNLRRNVEFRYQESEFLQKLIPNKKITLGDSNGGRHDLDNYEDAAGAGHKFTDIRLEFKNNKGHALVVKGYGAKTGVRGAKEMGQRPSIAILDDLVSDTDAESQTVINTIENTIYKAVSKALHPTRQKMVWLGTPFNARDPLYKAVESGAWNVSVYPICEHFPCIREEFRGSWEDRFPYDYVLDEYNEAIAVGKPENFNQELMLRIMSDEERIVPDNNIMWYKRANLLKKKECFNYYITTDFATTDREASDFSVISVWALNHKGYWFWVDGVCKKQDMGQNIKDLFRLAQKWNPESVGIEISGQQGGFIPWIQEKMMDKNCWFNLASENNKGKPGIKPNTNKMVRFNVVLPRFTAQEIFFPIELKDEDAMLECINELQLAAKGGFKSKHDDFIDTISMLPLLTVWRPSEVVPTVKSVQGIYEIEEDDSSESGMDSYIV